MTISEFLGAKLRQMLARSEAERAAADFPPARSFPAHEPISIAGDLGSEALDYRYWLERARSKGVRRHKVVGATSERVTLPHRSPARSGVLSK